MQYLMVHGMVLMAMVYLERPDPTVAEENIMEVPVMMEEMEETDNWVLLL